MIDDCNINHPHQESGLFRFSFVGVSPKFIELCMEMPCLCPPGLAQRIIDFPLNLLTPFGQRAKEFHFKCINL